MNSRRALVTGATSGMGKALALRLARQGFSVVVHGRSEQRCIAVVDEICEMTGASATSSWSCADLSDLDDVERLASSVEQRFDRLDLLVNNAGVGGLTPDGGARRISAQGHELRFAVNYLAGFALTERLLAMLTRSATDAAPSRVVNVSSEGLEQIDFDDVMLERDYDGKSAYFRSKLAQVMTTYDLAHRFGDSGVCATVLHPEKYMPTSIVLDRPEPPATGLLGSIDRGVEATLGLVESRTARAVNGRYFHGSVDLAGDDYGDHERIVATVGSRSADGLRQAADAGARKRLRELSEALIAR